MIACASVRIRLTAPLVLFVTVFRLLLKNYWNSLAFLRQFYSCAFVLQLTPYCLAFAGTPLLLLNTREAVPGL